MGGVLVVVGGKQYTGGQMWMFPQILLQITHPHVLRQNSVLPSLAIWAILSQVVS